MAFPDDLDPGNISALDRLKVAFACGCAKVIADADGMLDLNEIRMLMDVFSDDLMNACGFIDAKGAFTQKYRDAYDESRNVLPAELSEMEKLEILALLHSASTVDGEAHPKELKVVQQAADLLGISSSRLESHLDSL